MSQRTPNKTTNDSSNAFLLLLVIAASVGAGLPAIIAAALLVLWMRRAAPGDNERLTFVAVVAVIGIGVAVLLRTQYPDILPQLKLMLRAPRTADWWTYLLWLWLITLPFAPALAILLNVLLPKHAETRLAEQEYAKTARDKRTVRGAQKRALDAPDAVTDQRGQPAIVLGALISGDLHDWQHGQYLTFPEAVLREHAVAVGASGSGKTETLMRIAALAAKVYGWQVFYLDAKGESDTAARFLVAMEAAGLTNVPYFPAQKYDGWRGDPRALVNRFHSVETYSDKYYYNVATNVLSLAFNAPVGKPTTHEELVDRLSIERLRELYKGHHKASKVERLRPIDVHGVYQRYAGFFDALGDQLDGHWALEEVQAAYFEINGTAFRNEAAAFGRYMMEEIAHYVTERRHPHQRVLVIVDEFSAISATADAANLFERVRTFKTSVIVSSQSYAGLGNEAERLIGAAGTTIVHRCADPDELVKPAGTVQRYEQSLQTKEHTTTGRGTIRTKETLRVDPNAVRKLGTGECFVEARGCADRVQITPLSIDAEQGWHYLQRGGLIPGMPRVMTENGFTVRVHDPFSATPRPTVRRAPQPADLNGSANTPRPPVQPPAPAANAPTNGQTDVAASDDEPNTTPPLNNPAPDSNGDDEPQIQF